MSNFNRLANIWKALFGRLIVTGGLIISFHNPVAYGETCPEIASIPTGTDFLYTSLLEGSYSNLLVYREGSQLKVAKLIQGIFGLSVEPRFSVDVPGGVDVSTAFSNGDLVVAFNQVAAPSSGSFTTPDVPLSEIRFYRLTDGTLNTQRTFQNTTLSSLPVKSTSAPFYSSSWPFSAWKPPYCDGTSIEPGQLGRMVAATGNKLFVSNNAEQHNYCNDNPDYYQFHLDANGEREQRIAREIRDANGVPDPNSRPLCRVLWNPPPVVPPANSFSHCIGNPGASSCYPVTASGAPFPVPTPITPTPTPVPGQPTPTPTPTPSPTPQICDVRWEDIPILASEHCAECEFWWYLLDPGGKVYSSSGSGAPSAQSSIRFPSQIRTEIIDPPLEMNEMVTGPITAFKADPIEGGFGLAMDLSSTLENYRGFGGAFFFDANGNYRGFTSSFLPDAHGGTGGALAPLGRMSDGRAAWALGAPNPSPRDHPVWEELEEWADLLQPENGHVLYSYSDGDVFGFDFGNAANDFYGASVSAVGDLNYDFDPEALVGAPAANYAVVSAIGGTEENRGVLYRFSGEPGSNFGKQVGALSAFGSSRADVAVIASNSAIKFYDVSSCLAFTVPSETVRDQVRQLVIQAIEALSPPATPTPAATPAAVSAGLGGGGAVSLALTNPRIYTLMARVNEIVNLLPRGAQVIDDARGTATRIGQEARAFNDSLNQYDTVSRNAYNLSIKVQRARSKLREAKRIQDEVLIKRLQKRIKNKRKELKANRNMKPGIVISVESNKVTLLNSLHDLRQQLG